MNPQRVPGAPRLIDWTGERCVPWAPDPPVVYEHYHRYLFASHLVRGRNVLDLGSGEGFGSALLAETAVSVTGIDIEQEVIEHSRRNYSAENLTFTIADARELSQFEPATFGAVVAFELIEHLAEHERLLSAIERVLTPDGILVISCPDRAVYSEGRDFRNPFHVHELTYEELLSLLNERFANVRGWGQKLQGGSMIWPVDGGGSGADTVQRFMIERAGDDWRKASEITAMYALAVAGNGELPDGLPTTSWLVDRGDEMVHAVERAMAAEVTVRHELDSVRDELREVNDARAREREALANARDGLANERRLTEALQDRAAGDERTIAKLQSELGRYQSMVEGSVAWELFQRTRRFVYGLLGGRESPLGRLLEKSVRGLGRLIR